MEGVEAHAKAGAEELADQLKVKDLREVFDVVTHRVDYLNSNAAK